MKFEDYEASYITPQKTLLKKLNEVLKYLRLNDPEVRTLYKHTINFGNDVLIWVDKYQEILSIGIPFANRLKEAFFVNYKIINADTIYKALSYFYNYEGTETSVGIKFHYINSSGTTTAKILYKKDIVSQNTEVYL